jgi:hypothetical protein
VIGRIHVILGDWGYLFSAGFASWGNGLRKPGRDVTVWSTPQKIAPIIEAIKQQPPNHKTILVGNSLGGNACAWIAKAITHSIDLIVAFDPTRNGPSLDDYPLGPHVKRAICFKNLGHGPTSLLAGGAQLVGHQVEIVTTVTDHLFVQLDPRLRKIAEEAIDKVFA